MLVPADPRYKLFTAGPGVRPAFIRQAPGDNAPFQAPKCADLDAFDTSS